MRSTNAVILAILVLAAIGIVLFAPAMRWLSVVFAIAALFFAWRVFSARGLREQEERTRTTREVNRQR